jgi:hypothetical protein
MNIDSLPERLNSRGRAYDGSARMYWLDLLVLQYMANKIHATLHTGKRMVGQSGQLSYTLAEKQGRQHRLLLLDPSALQQELAISFVGFVSQRSPHAEQHVIDAIFRADALMLEAVVHIPGLFSYSSLELRPGLWYNLVLFGDERVKSHIKHLEIHRYAAHELSPAYYVWIRLHNGTLPGGLARQELCLLSTKHYRCSTTQQFTVTHELHSEPSTRLC